MSRIEDYLNENKYCILATTDGAGQPWAAPVYFVYDDARTIYWWSDVEAQHSKNIAGQANVYVTIFNSHAAEGSGKCLYMRCEASLVPDDQVEAVRQRYNQRTNTFKLSSEDVQGAAPTRLYEAHPTKFWQNVDAERDGKHVDVREELTV